MRVNVELTADELQALENLAWMVKNSKQNCGTRMKDAAEIAIKICKSKKRK